MPRLAKLITTRAYVDRVDRFACPPYFCRIGDPELHAAPDRRVPEASGCMPAR